MRHPLLGEIRSTEDLFRETFFAFVEHEVRRVRILIDPDGGPLETSVATAAAIKSRLEGLDHVARQRIVADLLETLNGDWNTYECVEEDGSVTKMQRMPFSDCQFYEQLVLDEIEITGDKTVRLIYTAGGLFRGGDIIVTSANGTDFTRVRIDLLPNE
jgi:hypothetical protein